MKKRSARTDVMLEMVTDSDRPYVPQLDELGYDTKTEFPLLSRAPISEGLIDIRAVLPGDVGLRTLQVFQTPIKDRFTERKERRSLVAQLRLGDERLELTEQGPVHPDGYIFRAESEGLIAQARLDGFTLSKVHPYVSWQHLRDNAEELWRVYLTVARPEAVTRLAVRYINRFEIPLGKEMKEYVATVPDLAAGIPQVIADHAMRLVVPHPSGAIAIINQSSIPRKESSATYGVVFDIDVFRSIEMQPSSVEVWRHLEELRIYKNRIFFNSITPRMLELFI